MPERREHKLWKKLIQWQCLDNLQGFIFRYAHSHAHIRQKYHSLILICATTKMSTKTISHSYCIRNRIVSSVHSHNQQRCFSALQRKWQTEKNNERSRLGKSSHKRNEQHKIVPNVERDQNTSKPKTGGKTSFTDIASGWVLYDNDGY